LIKVVLDANVLISGLISRYGPPGIILNTWIEGKFELVVSPSILEELGRVLHYPRIQKRLTEKQISEFLERLTENSIISQGSLKIEILTRDPSDNIYLSCAIEEEVNFLVTGNGDHFEEAQRIITAVQVISPREFLEILESS
jgi:uncharacterized protein